MEEHLLDIIIQNSNERWDQMLSQDADYVRIGENMSKKFARLAKVKLSKKQDKAVDELLTTYNEENAQSCKLIYKQGFIDCVSLLKEIGIIQ